MTRLARAAVALVGLAAVGFAAALVVVPDRVDAVLPVAALAAATPLSEGGLRAAAFGLVGVACLLWVAWTAAPDRTRSLPQGPFSEPDSDFRALREDPPEHATAAARVGDRFDHRLARTADGATLGLEDADEVRDDLRALAVDVVARESNCPADVARERVDAGEWTDDPVAAAYVADREASLPFYRRLLAWLRPWRATVRRVEAAIAAVEDRRSGGGER